MTRLDCRARLHFIRYQLRNLEEAARPDASHIRWLLAQAEEAYLSPRCEPRVARALHVAMNDLGAWEDAAGTSGTPVRPPKDGSNPLESDPN